MKHSLYYRMKVEGSPDSYDKVTRYRFMFTRLSVKISKLILKIKAEFKGDVK